MAYTEDDVIAQHVPAGHSAQSSSLQSSQTSLSSFTKSPPPSPKKRRRRKKFYEVERLYRCNFQDCNKAYGTLGHLNCHIVRKNHGRKRLPSEFKAIRERVLKRKLMREEQEKRQQLSQLSQLGQLLPPMAAPLEHAAPLDGYPMVMGYSQNPSWVAALPTPAPPAPLMTAPYVYASKRMLPMYLPLPANGIPSGMSTGVPAVPSFYSPMLPRAGLGAGSLPSPITPGSTLVWRDEYARYR